MKTLTLASLFILVNIAFAQTPDTITVETQRIKGFGPFPHSFGILQPMPPESPWIKAAPKIKGVPDSLSGLVLFIEQVDSMQYTYQNYFAGKISEELYNTCKKDWNWNPDSAEYTKDLVKVNIAIAVGYDRNGNLVILADRNNNYDLSDDEYYIVPAKIPGQDFWGRYNDSLPINVKYEYYDGKEIKKDSTWLYLDYSPFNYKSDKKDKPVQLANAFTEHHLGEFNFDGKKYFIALKSDRAVFHNFYSVKVWENDKDDQSNLEQGQQKGELLEIGKYYYKIANLSVDGKQVALVKESDVEQKGGNHVGLKALNISSKSISGKIIDLKNYRGKYVLLNFWGTWCSPCRHEIPALKSIYKKYRNKNFAMISIAQDNIDSVKSFIKEKQMSWPQIIQDKSRSIINLYGVHGFPTTFLINPEGKIIFKDSDPILVENELKSIFKN